jgi:hypothetical protein
LFIISGRGTPTAICEAVSCARIQGQFEFVSRLPEKWIVNAVGDAVGKLIQSLD